MFLIDILAFVGIPIFILVGAAGLLWCAFMIVTSKDAETRLLSVVIIFWIILLIPYATNIILGGM